MFDPGGEWSGLDVLEIYYLRSMFGYIWKIRLISFD